MCGENPENYQDGEKKHPVLMTIALCAFIFFLSFKPSEPHLTTYLEERGFTDFQINSIIYPVWGYAYFVFLVICFFLVYFFPEKFSFRPLLLVGVFGRIATRFILLFGRSVWLMVLAEIGYALGSVSEVVFTGYIFRVVPMDWFLATTSYTSSAFLASHVLSGLLGDLLLQEGIGLRWLLVISAASVVLSALIAFFFFPSESPSPSPSPPSSTASSSSLSSPPSSPSSSPSSSIFIESTPLPLHNQPDLPPTTDFLRDFKQALKSPELVRLSIWYYLMQAVYGFVYGYETSLSASKEANLGDWNGTILGSALLFGSVLTIAFSQKWLNAFIDRHLNIFFVVVSVVATLSFIGMCWYAWPWWFVGLLVFFGAVVPGFARYNAYWGRFLTIKQETVNLSLLINSKPSPSPSSSSPPSPTLSPYSSLSTPSSSSSPSSHTLSPSHPPTNPPYLLFALFNGILALSIQDIIQLVVFSAFGMGIDGLWLVLFFFSCLSTLFLVFSIVMERFF